MSYRKSNIYINLVNSYIIDSPQPSSINYWYNLGSLLGLCLIIQIITGVFIAIHYSSNIELAFSSVEHIIRDVNIGWLIRYIHANTASFFFAVIYIHIGKGLYYGSYRKPRSLVWNIGVIIFIATIAAAFLGYCCVYGQISHWGIINAQNVLIFIIIIIIKPIGWIFNYIKIIIKESLKGKNIIYLKILNRKEINNYKGPLNIDIISIIYGSLLGNSYGENIKQGTRFVFQQENIHTDYLYYLHSLVANIGYCNTNLPLIKTRLGKQGKIKQYLKFNTWTYLSFNSIYNEWYKLNKQGKYIKIVPRTLHKYLTPLALAIWIIDDDCKLSKGLKLVLNYFNFADVQYLVYLLYNIYNIKATIQKGNIENTQYIIYIWKESIPNLANIVSPYIIPSIKYKLNGYL